MVSKKIVVSKKKAVSPKAESPKAESLSTKAPRKPRKPRAPRAAARPRTKAAAPATPAVRTVTQEEIRVRAYFLSLEHAGHGHDTDFWLMAERELAQGHGRGE